MAPSIANHAQSMPFKASYRLRPARQNRSNTPASVHSMKRRCAELLEQIPVPLSAFHWQPVRNTNKMAFMAARFSTRGRWHPNGWGFGLCAGRSGSIFDHSASLIRQPSSLTTSPIVVSSSIIIERLQD
jgi:hypothetical protein